MKNKKIGIITFHRANNYGAVLQNLALVNVIRNYEHVKVYTIDYRCDFLEKPYRTNPFEMHSKNFINMFRKKLYNQRYIKMVKAFDEFRVQNLNMTDSYTYKELCNQINSFDTLVTGSDQVWNDNITNGDVVYSLGLTCDSKKVSYAASAGKNSNIGNQTKKNITDLDVVSVREEDLKDYIESEINRNVDLVCDPVFLLDKTMWESLLPKERIIRDKFIFTYSVSEKTDDVISIAKKIAKDKGCKIAHLDFSIKYGIKGIQMYGASPLDFLRLIRDAEVVVASSFHAVAFSIILGKNFWVVPTEKTGSRIDNLLCLAGLQERSISNKESFKKDIGEIIDSKNNQLNSLIEKSKKFIEDNIIN